MFRRVCILLSAGSLVLGAAVLTLWLRSYRTRDVAAFRGGGVRWWAVSDRGTIRVDNEPQRETDRAAIGRRLAENLAKEDEYLDRSIAISEAKSTHFRSIFTGARQVARWWAESGLPARPLPYLPGADQWLDRLSRILQETMSESAADGWTRLDAADAALRRGRAALHAERVRLLGARPAAAVVRQEVRNGTLVAATAAVPAAWLTATALGRFRRRRLRVANRCAGCGYDLRATPGRCPECGRVPHGMAAGDVTPEPERAATRGGREGRKPARC